MSSRGYPRTPSQSVNFGLRRVQTNPQSEYSSWHSDTRSSAASTNDHQLTPHGRDVRSGASVRSSSTTVSRSATNFRNENNPRKSQNDFDNFGSDEAGSFSSYDQDDLADDDDFYVSDSDDGTAKLCIVCKARPPFSKGGITYPTCGRTCRDFLDQGKASQSIGSPTSRKSASSVNSFYAASAARSPLRTSVSGQSASPSSTTSESTLIYVDEDELLSGPDTKNRHHFDFRSPPRSTTDHSRQPFEAEDMDMALALSASLASSASNRGRSGGKQRQALDTDIALALSASLASPTLDTGKSTAQWVSQNSAAVPNSPYIAPVARTAQRAPMSGKSASAGLVNSMANLSVRRGNITPSVATSPRAGPASTPRAPAHKVSRSATMGAWESAARPSGPSTRGHLEFGPLTSTTKMPDTNVVAPHRASATSQLCVVCVRKPCQTTQFLTCGPECTEKLAMSGPYDKTKCDFCHRHPKVSGKNQCGLTCAEKAKIACLFCRCRLKLKGYHLCGKFCQQIAAKLSPLILEVPQGHITYNQVKKTFLGAWKYPERPIPAIKKVYKIIENQASLRPYEAYKKAHGNMEVFRYHATSKMCTLGTASNNTLCKMVGCAVCSTVRTSFKASLANSPGLFGRGIYSSSASNKAFSDLRGGTGVMILSKAVLGNAYPASAWDPFMSCPLGYNSVVFDNEDGALNETIVYTDNAIRPVFLIIF